MNNEELISQYRTQLLILHGITIAIISFVEIAAYLAFVYAGIHKLSLTCSYLWFSVVAPVIINSVAHIAAKIICNSRTLGIRTKNHSVIYATVITSFAVSVFHRDYLITSCAFVFPIILSAMYNDKQLLKNSLFSSLLLLTLTVIVLSFENKMNIINSLIVLVLYGFITVSYLSGLLSINFSQRNFALIEMQALTNVELESKVVKDQMTGLYNHETFYEKLNSIIELSNSILMDCCVVIIDIDDFKNINDTYGHHCGDKVLTDLADILKNCCMEGDYACRYGGEEFTLILCNKSLAEAKKISNTALKLFSKHKFEFTKKRITFSGGIAKLRENETKESLFARADNYLYISKKNGKNRITSEA